MKYFSLSYWFKVWLLAAPLFSDQIKNSNIKAANNKDSTNQLVSKNINNIWPLKKEDVTLGRADIKHTKQIRGSDFYQWDLILQRWLNQQLPRYDHQRFKRKNNDDFKKIIRVAGLTISNINSDYQASIVRILTALQQHNILEVIFDRDNVGADANIVPDTIYEANDQNYHYFVIPIFYESGSNIALVFSTNTIYLQGFLVNNYYYHFSDAQLSTFANFFPDQEIAFYHSVALPFVGHYSELWTERLRSKNINWYTIVTSFNNLRNYHHNNVFNQQIIRESLALVILTTAESFRFRTVYQLISATIEHDRLINWYTDIQPIVNNWSVNSQTVLQILTSISNVRANANLLRLLRNSNYFR